MTKRKLLYGLLLFVVGTGGVLLVLHWMLKPSPQDLFTRWILDPIPKSVTGIRSYTVKDNISGYKYLFHFKISEDDIEKILASRPFKKLMQLQFAGDFLERRWDERHTGCTNIYRAPKWFKPQDLPEAQAYIADYGDSGAPKYWTLAYSNRTDEVCAYVCYSKF